MPAVISSSPEATCMKCTSTLDSLGLKCSRCSAVNHLRCSDLPIYVLLRYKTSQSAFVCRACVLAEGNPESLQEAQKLLEEVMAREEAKIESDLVDSENGDDEKIKEKTQSTPPEQKTSEFQDKKDDVRQSATCKFYLRQACKNGRKGTDCKYSHPKLCFKFIKHGDRKSGCNKGNKCEFVHPKLCNSYKSGVCTRKKCNLYHIRGTSFQTADFEQANCEKLQSDRTTLMPQRNEHRGEQPRRILRRPPAVSESEITLDVGRSAGSSQSQVNPRDFLEIQVQLKSVQDQLQILLSTRYPMERALPRTSVWGT